MKFLPPPQIKALLLSGGATNIGQDLQELKQGVDIVTATLGRLMVF